MLFRRHLAAAFVLIPALSFSSGCEFLEQFEDGGGLVDVYVAHTPTAQDGAFPPAAGDHFVVKGDHGWKITVTDAYVTTTGLTLERCDGAELESDFYWGAKCEDLVGGDIQAQGVGAVSADEGSYCAATVTYGPFVGDGEGGHAGTGGGIEGATVYLAGVAKRGNQSIPFQVSTVASVRVHVDLSALENGEPVEVGHDQYFNKQLTFSKTYDRFFDGIDFENLKDYDWDAILLDTLVFETTAHYGTDVLPQPG